MNYYLFSGFLILLFIASLIIPSLKKKSKKHLLFSAILMATSMLSLIYMTSFVRPQLENNAKYTFQEELDIVWNQADKQYYVNFKGKPLKLRDACPEQFGYYIKHETIKQNPKVKVYQKTFVKKGFFYLQKTPVTHFVHGEDLRIEDNTKIK